MWTDAHSEGNVATWLPDRGPHRPQGRQWVLVIGAGKRAAAVRFLAAGHGPVWFSRRRKEVIQ